MYAIVRDGCHQMRVEQGETVRLAFREGAEPGSELQLDQVLLVGEGADVRIGEPLVEGVSVTARVTAHVKGKKVIVYRMKRRKNHHRKQGHRQRYTEAVIESING